MRESLARDKNVGLLDTTPILWNKRVKSKGKRIGTSKKEKTTVYSMNARCWQGRERGCGCMDLRASDRLEFAALAARGRVVDRGCQS